jgi:hypothetical protein
LQSTATKNPDEEHLSNLQQLDGSLLIEQQIHMLE